MSNNKLKCFNFLLAILLILFEYLDFIKTLKSSIKCEKNEFYDTNIYDCAKCPENMEPSKDGKLNLKIN
jgi:hypothetical protein